MSASSTLWVLAMAAIAVVTNTHAFAPNSISALRTRQQQQQQPYSAFSSALFAKSPSVAIPNPFKKLPWNVQKEREREARRLKLERAKLHRELGIVEDATYEEIVEATERLIQLAGSDLKRKIKIEVAKDKILQIRLNERLAGLAAQSKEARAQSTYEIEGYVSMWKKRVKYALWVACLKTLFLFCFSVLTTTKSQKQPKNGMLLYGLAIWWSNRMENRSRVKSVCGVSFLSLAWPFHRLKIIWADLPGSCVSLN